jgi:hypothetical protein
MVDARACDERTSEGNPCSAWLILAVAQSFDRLKKVRRHLNDRSGGYAAHGRSHDK